MALHSRESAAAHKSSLTLLLAVIVLIAGLCGCRGESSGSQPSVSIMPEGSKVVDFPGPILTMTAAQEAPWLTAGRTLELDFSLWEKTGCAAVDDSYILTNSSQEEEQITVCYPISSSLEKWESHSARLIRSDNVPVEVQVRMGPSDTGPLQFELYGAEAPDWEEIREKLDQYYLLERALAGPMDLSKVMVSRYRIADIRYEADGQIPEAAGFCLEFFQNQTGISILEEGFTHSSCFLEEEGSNCKLFVPASRGEGAFLTTLGGELEDYILHSYVIEDYFTAHAPDSGLTALTARLEEEKIPLSQVLEEAEQSWLAQSPTQADRTLLLQGAGELLAEWEKFDPSTGHGNSYTSGWLMKRTLEQNRIFWLVVPVTIPAGESVTLTARFNLAGGLELYGPAAREGVQRYDLTPQYGTALDIAKQTVTIRGMDQITILAENIGLDGQSGAPSVELDPQLQYAYWTVSGQ